MAQQNGVIPASSPCGGGSAYRNGAANFGTTACLNAAAFVNTSDPSFKGYTRWPSQTRNQFRGPNYIDFDMGLYKMFQIKDRLTLGVGATAFNVFNHPNFGAINVTCGATKLGATCNNPLFGQAKGTLSSASTGGLSSLYMEGGPRSLQFALKLEF